MKILFLTTVLPNKNTAVGNVEYNIIKHLLSNNNIIDQVIYLGNEEQKIVEDLGIRKTYFFKLNTKQRIVQLIKYVFEPCMMVFRKTKPYNKQIEELLSMNNYDLVFVTYSQLGFVGQLVKKWNIPSILLIYDVLYQSFTRKTKNTKNLLKKLFYYCEKIKCYRKETLYYNNFDNLVCLTNKDKNLLMELNCKTKISVMQTCYHDFGFKPEVNQDFCVCYFAAFDRMENIDAVKFYITNIHSQLKKKYENYKFIVIGKDAEKNFSVEDRLVVLGFQEHPEEILNKCSMSILPLRVGAGVKTKVLELLAMGIPCICSPVASEGIDDTYGLETYFSLEQCFSLVDKWYSKNIFNEKINIRNEFLEKYPENNTFDIINKLINEVYSNV